MFCLQPSPMLAGGGGPPPCTPVDISAVGSGISESPHVGVFYSLDPNAYNTGGAATFWSIDMLPSGLSLNASTGIISGTPTTVESMTSQLTIDNSCTTPDPILYINFNVT